MRPPNLAHAIWLSLKFHILYRLRFLLVIFLSSVQVEGADDVNSTNSIVLRAVEVTTPDGSREEHFAKRNDVVIIEVQDLNAWLESPNVTNALPKNKRVWTAVDVVPFIDGHMLNNVPLENVSTWGRVTYLKYRLVRNNENKDVWKKLLNRPRLNRKVTVSVGVSGDLIWYMPTMVSLDADEKHDFNLIIIPWFQFGTGLSIIVLAFLIFLKMARDTDIIRDSTAAYRPDRRAPLSLARAQMAFWFFLVIASYFFLWVLTGDTDTLTASVLGLIGISAGTALGAAVIDASKSSVEDKFQNVPSVDLSRPGKEIVKELETERSNAEAALKVLKGEEMGIPFDQHEQRQAIRLRAAAILNRILLLRDQIHFFRRKPLGRGLFDLLADNGAISFHRFQIFVWTLVLGVIFISQVYGELTMPEFSSTLLGLMGISAGTYVGFKIPEQRH